MKSRLSLIAAILLFAGNCFSQHLQWINKIKHSGFKRILSQKVAEGKVYFLGDFEDSISIGNKLLRSKGDKDLFFAVSDTAGNWISVESFGGEKEEIGGDLHIDKNGKVYITGSTSSKEFTFRNKSLSAKGRDLFLGRISKDGVLDWLTTAYGEISFPEVIGYGVTTDSSGNCYLTGRYDKAAVFGNYTLSNSAMPGYALAIFIAKTDSNGVFEWAESRGEVSNNYSTSYGYDIVCDKADNLLITGGYYRGGTSPDIFLFKYDTKGNAIWSKVINDGGYDYGTEIFTDDSLNIYLTGKLGGSADFEGTYLETQFLGDKFISRFDSSGKLNWVRLLNAEVSISSEGEIGFYTTFSNSLNLDGKSVTGKGYSSAFGKLNNLTGKCDSLVYIGGQPGISKIALTSDRSFILSGAISSPLAIADVTLTAESPEIFISKIGPGGKIANIENSSQMMAVIMPNPVTDKIIIQADNLSSGDLMLYAADGSLSFARKNITFPVVIDSRELSAGIFYVQILSGQNIFTGKLIKD
jgi:hypothetical protein